MVISSRGNGAKKSQFFFGPRIFSFFFKFQVFPCGNRLLDLKILKIFRGPAAPGPPASQDFFAPPSAGQKNPSQIFLAEAILGGGNFASDRVRFGCTPPPSLPSDARQIG